MTKLGPSDPSECFFLRGTLFSPSPPKWYVKFLQPWLPLDQPTPPLIGDIFLTDFHLWRQPVGSLDLRTLVRPYFISPLSAVLVYDYPMSSFRSFNSLQPMLLPGIPVDFLNSLLSPSLLFQVFPTREHGILPINFDLSFSFWIGLYECHQGNVFRVLLIGASPYE